MPSPSRIRSRRHPTRTQSTNLVASLSYIFFLFLTIVILCPITANAESQTHLEYGTVIGVDLGRTYSCVGVYKLGGQVEIIPNDLGDRITPSWVGFHGDVRLIGESAKNAFHSNPKNTVFDVKRLIDCPMEEPEVKRDLTHLQFMVKERNGAPVITGDTAEAYLGHGVTHAVVTFSAYFNDAQQQATKNTGEIAGLKVLRVLNELTAAALAHGMGKTGSESKVIVYDLGGGTFDASLLSIEDGDFEVLATAGDTHLGGEDFDNRVIDDLVKAYDKETGTDVSSNQHAMSKLKKAVELAKRKLSVQRSAKIEIESFENGNDFSETLTRAKFEEPNLELFKKTVKPVVQVLVEIVLVGGSTRIPKVQELLKDYFGKDPPRGINPDEVVAYGAVIQGAILSGLKGPADTIPLLDINSLTLGIEVNGGVFAPIIKRNTVIPMKKSQIKVRCMLFSTTVDNQPTMMIKVFEGERGQTKFNHLPGEFELAGIPPAAKGIPPIEVTFELDANSITTIRALDKGTVLFGKSESIVITKDKGNLSQEKFDRMIAEGEMFAAEDLLHKMRTGALNDLFNFVYGLRSQLSEKDGVSKRFPAHDEKKLQQVLKAGSEWMEGQGNGSSLEDLEEKFVELQTLVNPIVHKWYQEEPRSKQSPEPGDEWDHTEL